VFFGGRGRHSVTQTLLTIRPINQWSKNVTQEGSEKCQKSVTYYLNDPLWETNKFFPHTFNIWFYEERCEPKQYFLSFDQKIFDVNNIWVPLPNMLILCLLKRPRFFNAVLERLLIKLRLIYYGNNFIIFTQS
jgi:hypothetical protein